MHLLTRVYHELSRPEIPEKLITDPEVKTDWGRTRGIFPSMNLAPLIGSLTSTLTVVTQDLPGSPLFLLSPFLPLPILP